ncbi:MAG: YbaK/EbsC family protein [Pyrinomonadaceae bacterium]
MSFPITQAIRFLREKNIEFTPHQFEYREKGGTSHSSSMLGVEEDLVVKTLIFETNEKEPFVVLMEGPKMVSTKKMARVLGVKSVGPVTPERANRLSGYLVGGTSPFGMKNELKVFAEESIFTKAKIFINGGARGFLVEIDPLDLLDALDPGLVNVGVERH